MSYIDSFLTQKKVWILTQIFTLIAIGLLGKEASAQTGRNVKWHPGHYLHCQVGKDKSGYSWGANECYPEIESHSALQGIEIRFNWADLETSKDVYNFKHIDEHLKRLSTQGTKKKRFFMIVETKTFDPKFKLVPCYLTTSTCPGYANIYEGGIYPYHKPNKTVKYGDGIRFWNNNVRDRFVKLMKALGNRYNGHTHFEGIGLGETAMGEPMASAQVSAADVNAYYDAHLFIQEKMIEAFPNTITTQFTNSPRSMMSYFIGNLQKMGASLGGSDVLLDDKSLNAINIPNQQDGAYSYYPKLSGEVALTPSVMSSNYVSTSTDPAKSRKPTIDELLNFSRDKLKATHLFWTRDDAGYYKQALNKIQTLKDQNNPRWKLSTACPSTFVPCRTN